MSKLTTALLIAATSLLTVGCGLFMGSAMGTAEIEQYGTHIVSAPKEKVFKAVTGTLQSSGFAIAVENREKGIIKTDRRLIRAGYNGDMAVGYYRRYDIRINELSQDKFQIVATPKVYAGDKDLSDGNVWVLDGSEGERQLWKSLFKEIDDLL